MAHWSLKQVTTRHILVLLGIQLWQDDVDNIGGVQMNGSIYYNVVQKAAEAEHQQRIAANLARARYANGESPIRIQFRRIVNVISLNWKAVNERPTAVPCVQMADSSQPC